MISNPGRLIQLILEFRSRTELHAIHQNGCGNGLHPIKAGYGGREREGEGGREHSCQLSRAALDSPGI